MGQTGCSTGCSIWSRETWWHSLYHLRFTCKVALFESRRADSNRLPLLITRTNRYISGCMRLLQNPISKPNTRTSNIVEQPEIWPGWCTNGVRAQHLWQPFWCRAPSVGVSRPRLASLGPADTVSPFVRRDFLELAVYGGDEEAEVLLAEGVGYKDAAWVGPA